MDTALFFVVIALVAAGIIAASYFIAEARRKAFRAVAQQYGLTYYPKDPYNTVKMNFSVFQRGSSRKVTNVLVGRGADGAEIRAFDYKYTTGSGDSQQTHQRSCVMNATGANWPHLTLRREGFGDKLVRMVGVRDHELESEEFNKAFQIDADDPRFATAVLDPRMMEWLLAAGVEDAVEIFGPWVFESFNQVGAAGLPALVQRTEHFRAQIPRVVWDLYPPPPT